MDGLQMLLRWIHIYFGIIWIGHLYYFNFVQGAFFNETDGTTKSNAIQKLVPRALWWFRYGALYTILSGLVLIMSYLHQSGFGALASGWGVTISIGMTFGTLMFLNVWLIIWPNQKIVIASATQVGKGGSAIPEAAAAGAKAGLASRHNTLFSVPMLFFMVCARHLPIETSETSNYGLLAVVVAIIILGLQFNGMKGKTGVITTIKGVITWGFVLTAVLYGLVEILL
jgi:uncharacterized membrane protein